MAEYSKEVSFWNLLKEKEVIVPIIQRDYAQGRIGQEYLRQRFLDKIFSAFSNEKESQLLLDFVYGSTEQGQLFPLDGQQRLTTLWLIHWYCAFVSGELKNDKDVLKRFSYQTRISSRKFCEQLCNIDSVNAAYDYESPESTISMYLRNQCWFYSSYDQDPTVQSMIRMLGGSDIDDKNGNDIVDGIEEICRAKRLSREDILHIYEILKSDSCPVRFFLLNMEDKNMPLTDDLYIKMNARGKALTDYENFKVDLLDYKIDKDTPLFVEDKASEESFSHKLDTSWTDLFWSNRSSDYKIDGIMMQFFNRYFLDWYISKGSLGKKPEIIISETFYKYMTSTGQDYQSISIYSPALTKDSISSLSRCLDGMYSLYKKMEENIDTFNALFQPFWIRNITDEQKKENATFYFLPKYLSDGEISKITQVQRVVFHSICMFFERNPDPDPKTLQEWMHFVWNIAENSYIDREQAITAIRFLNDLQKLSEQNLDPVANINLFLQSIDEESLSADIFGKRQLMEEIAKSKKCYDGQGLDLVWKQKIEEAERTLFFKGAIAFLFNDENGVSCDWSNFDKKLETAKKIFDNNGLKKEYQVLVMSRFFQLCTDYDSQLWWSKKVFTSTSKTWRDNIFLHVDRNYQYVYCSNIHHILLDDDYMPSPTDDKIEALANPLLVRYLFNKNKDNRDMYIRNPHNALYFCGAKQGILLSYTKRDRTITEILKDERFSLRNPDVAIEGTGKFWGFDIDFIFNNEGTPIYLRWFNNGSYDVYIMDDNWNWKSREHKRELDPGDRKNWLCFNVEENCSPEMLINRILEELNSDNIIPE